MARPLFLLALLATALAATSTLGRRGGLLGGWSPVPDVNDAHVQELGGWAVAQHASLANDGLLFRRVTRGEQQVVSGMNYRLLVVAADGSGKSVIYLAQIYEHWSGTRKLTSFKPAAGG
ncbi:cysteine proteinase inhibitor 8 [Aegilops tauschii subsp. strangulata]|nr:cysteine proteinase inhibitor 8 [Aegilops tauschii subsp. strangulata]